MRTNLSACRTHEGGGLVQTSAQELTQRDRKTVSHPALPGDLLLLEHSNGHAGLLRKGAP